MRWCAVASVACLALACGAPPARGDTTVQLGFVRVDPDRFDGPEMNGLGATMVYGSDVWLCFPLTVDFAAGEDDWLAPVAFGLRLGPTGGPVRPWAELQVGLVLGSVNWAGGGRAFGGGIAFEAGPSVDAFFDLHSVGAGNLYEGGHAVMGRVGFALRRTRGD